MIKHRKVIKAVKSRPTLEGAGVHLKRAFGFGDEHQYDPFLLLDDFRSDTPEYYIKGFPWHPHRGIETITYVLRGEVEHSDSMGNRGVISAGDVQWMTAGNGIIHQEMPHGDPQGRMHGFQLWANLPASHKMMDPRYREIKSAQIPEVTLDKGVKVRVICGEVGGQRGPVQDIITQPEYLDVSIPPSAEFVHTVHSGFVVLAYVFEGQGVFGNSENSILAANTTLVQFGDGNLVKVSTGEEESIRFLLFSGKPIEEPIAWYGPIVMNTREELETAFEEFQNGTFLKHSAVQAPIR